MTIVFCHLINYMLLFLNGMVIMFVGVSVLIVWIIVACWLLSLILTRYVIEVSCVLWAARVGPTSDLVLNSHVCSFLLREKLFDLLYSAGLDAWLPFAVGRGRGDSARVFEFRGTHRPALEVCKRTITVH